MITPAYSPTATERVLPRMALDFTTGTLDPRVTVTRALNTATRVNSSGYIEGVNANLPRFDYNPSTLAPLGLLIEESRTNQIKQSQALGTSPWTVSAATISADQAISPDGTQNADLLYPASTGTSREVYQAAGYTGGVAYTLSIYAKAAGMSWITFGAGVGSGAAARLAFFNVSTGVVGTTGASISNASITSVGNGWYRISLRYTPAGAGGFIEISPVDGDNNYTGTKTGTNGVYLWGAQIEVGAFATSYIPTTTTSLTRNADVVSMTGTNFSDWYNASEGAFVVEALRYDNAARTAAAFDVDDGTAANYIQLSSTATSGRGIIRVSSGTAINLSAGSAAVTTPAKLTMAYKNASFAFSSGGAAPATNAASAVPTVSQALIGSGINGSYLNGAVSKVMYWPQRLINAEVQSFSK